MSTLVMVLAMLFKGLFGFCSIDKMFLNLEKSIHFSIGEK